MKTIKMNGGTMTVTDEFYESFNSSKASKAEERCKKLTILLKPRCWGRAQHEAWHKNIPNLDKAFEALLLSIDEG